MYKCKVGKGNTAGALYEGDRVGPNYAPQIPIPRIHPVGKAMRETLVGHMEYRSGARLTHVVIHCQDHLS